MFKLSCGDVMPGCPETFEAAEEEGVLAQVAPHAAEAHGITAITPDLVAQVRRHVVRRDDA